MLDNGILKYQGPKLCVKGKLRVKQEGDLIIDRIETVSRFFPAHKMTTTNDISLLAKVHLLSRTNREDAQKDVPAHIQRQARFLGWSGLANTDREKITQYVHLSDALEAKLPTALLQ